MSVRSRILIVDDEESMRFFLERTLRRAGYAVQAVATAEEALTARETFPTDLVITDVRLPGLSGLELLRKLREQDPGLPVILITGYGTIQDAVAAMKLGAADYVTKPFPGQLIRSLVARLLPSGSSLPLLLGESPALAAIREQLRRVAPSDATVLLTGESGTGKEVAARLLHAWSPRRERPFVAVHCAALPPTLLEAELFGHVAGAFTGAHRDRQGLAARAADGTLFLDEVGDIPLPLQTKLLRLLEAREIQPVGADEVLPFRARVVAATNQDLQALMAAGRFREDLFYRLHVVPLHLPPLRERRGDIPLLAAHFLTEANRRHSRQVEGFRPAALARLERYPWPGNVRELRNLVERLVALKGEGWIEVADLPPELEQAGGGTLARSPYEEARRAFEREYFARLLAETSGNISEAARRAGISRPNLYRRLKETGLR